MCVCVCVLVVELNRYQGNPDPATRAGLMPHWAALHIDGWKLLVGSGAKNWSLYRASVHSSPSRQSCSRQNQYILITDWVLSYP